MLLKELSQVAGVSGHEADVRRVILDQIQGLGCQHRVDSLGNLIVVKDGTGTTRRRVMVSAHMDEIGFMVVHIEKDGWLRFRPVGGLDDRVLLSKRVLIGDGRIPGVIGVKPIHLLDERERKQVVRVREMSMDVGASSREDAARIVQVGDYATFDTEFIDLGGPLRAVKGKAFDDRAGCAALIELLRDSYPFDLYAVFTVQEEVGLRGAQVAAYAIEPELAFALEGTLCDELPKKRDVSPGTQLGKGPAITIMDRSVIADRKLVDLLVGTAERDSIPYQFKQPLVGGTDAGAIHRTRTGVPSVVVSIPARYIHSAVSLLSLHDLDGTVRLMRAALGRLNDLDMSQPS